MAMGPQAVTRALKACWWTRSYLVQDSLDVAIVPEFGRPGKDEDFSTKVPMSRGAGSRRAPLAPVERRSWRRTNNKTTIANDDENNYDALPPLPLLLRTPPVHGGGRRDDDATTRVGGRRREQTIKHR